MKKRVWNNFGKPVTAKRLCAAEQALKDMLPEADTGLRMEILGFFRKAVRHDTPASVLGPDPEHPVDKIDLTGRYRLLATMVAE